MSLMRPKREGPNQKVPGGLARLPGAMWEDAPAFAADMAQAQDIILGATEARVASVEGRMGGAHPEATIGPREVTPQEAYYEDREIRGRDQNLLDRQLGGLADMGRRAGAGLRHATNIIGPPGWIAGAAGLQAANRWSGTMGERKGFGEHYEDVLGSYGSAGEWAMDNLSASQGRLEELGVQTPDIVGAEMFLPLAPFRTGRLARAGRALGSGDDMAVVGRGTVSTSGGPGNVYPTVGLGDGGLAAERAAYRAAEVDRMARADTLGSNMDYGVTTNPDQFVDMAGGPRTQHSPFDQGAGALAREAPRGSMRAGHERRMEERRMEELELAGEWDENLQNLRSAAEADDPDLALDILNTMDEMEHGSNVTFEARDIARSMRVAGNDSEAAVLEQAADDYYDRMPEEIQSQYSEDAYYVFRERRERAEREAAGGMTLRDRNRSGLRSWEPDEGTPLGDWERGQDLRDVDRDTLGVTDPEAHAREAQRLMDEVDPGGREAGSADWEALEDLPTAGMRSAAGRNQAVLDSARADFRAHALVDGQEDIELRIIQDWNSRRQALQDQARELAGRHGYHIEGGERGEAVLTRADEVDPPEPPVEDITEYISSPPEINQLRELGYLEAQDYMEHLSGLGDADAIRHAHERGYDWRPDSNMMFWRGQHYAASPDMPRFDQQDMDYAQAHGNVEVSGARPEMTEAEMQRQQRVGLDSILEGRQRDLGQPFEPSELHPAPKNMSEDLPARAEGMTHDQALRWAKSGNHLKWADKEQIQFVGAPKGVGSRESVQKRRDSFDEDVRRGLIGAQWYARSQESIGGLSRSPERAGGMARELALMSSQAPPGPNYAWTIEGRNAIAAGEPGREILHTGKQWQGMNRSPVGPLSLKTEPFSEALTPGGDPTYPANDRWMADAWGYPENVKSPSASQHRWMDGETILSVERMNAESLGGRSDWHVKEVQAMAWTTRKALAIVKARNIPMEEALEIASKDYSYHVPWHRGYGTNESVPGVPDHLEPMKRASWEKKKAFHDDPRSSWTDEQGMDDLYEAVGIYQEPTVQGRGVYRNSAGELEYNPVNVTRPQLAVVGEPKGLTKEGKVKKVGKMVAPTDLAAARKVEALRGAIDAQEMTAMHKDIPVGSKMGGSGAQMGQGTGFTIEHGRDLTEGELSEIMRVAEEFGFAADDSIISNRGRSTVLSGFGPRGGLSRDAPRLRGALAEAGVPMKEGAGGLYPSRTDSAADFYDWSEPGSGNVTRQLFEILDGDEAPEILARLEADPSWRQRALDRMERDADAAIENGWAVRQDVQNFRRIVGEGGLEALRQALRDGAVLPGLALPVLLMAMQEERDEAA